MPDPANQQPSVEGATSDRQEDPNMPAPPSPSDQQVGREAREVPPQQQEAGFSGKATTGERKEKSTEAESQKASSHSSVSGVVDKDTSSGNSRQGSDVTPPGAVGPVAASAAAASAAGSAATFSGPKEGVKDGSFCPPKDKKSVVSNKHQKKKSNKQHGTPISPVKTPNRWK